MQTAQCKPGAGGPLPWANRGLWIVRVLTASISRAQLLDCGALPSIYEASRGPDAQGPAKPPARGRC